MRLSIIIPTYNPGILIRNIFETIKPYSQRLDSEIIVIDSSSTDGSLGFLEKENVKVIRIPKSEFNHGGTRNKAAHLAKGDILVYLTQDAIPVDSHSIEKLIKPLLENTKIGMAYGRQLPRADADFFGAFARKFNYPEESQIKTLKDVNKLGIKTVFVSNSFAAYRKEYLMEVGGFPTNTILSEDTYVAARMLKKGLAIAYVAEAQVYHSHNYTIIEEFKRYFDIGVFYGRENWILKEFAKAEGEGAKFAVEQLRAIIKEKKYYLIPPFFIRNAMKFLGYRLGIYEKIIPLTVKKKISMHKQFWDQ
ncbi:O antigen biosynthesis rhamnosyltransferase rfbN [Geobacillus stearothermophilus]|uniref:O antigen biosynthesis rhamnosyltransferase rfbN n=1 Tax=Geobacillus stearothermophilus TaxID=1422 RepID=A0ABQ7HJH9_GEOSE|nr:glycosyltransferase family 2 protein [Geobacillus stearothermophilus]KAF6512385.1 O antigen biosynthesis rhamnosyltransferase rfbN [Geobacillus stearothermophilus]